MKRISLIADELSKLSKRELFERVKDLDEAIEELREDLNDPEIMYWEGEYLPNAVGDVTHDFNQHYVLLFRRMFAKHKFIYRINPEW